MSERFSDEVLREAIAAYLPEKVEADAIAAMRAVLEGHLADKIVLNAPDGKCPECRHSVDNHHANCPIGRIVASDGSPR